MCDEKSIGAKKFAYGASENIKELSSSVYYDKALGSWIGQMIGNILGLPTEGRFIDVPSPEYMPYYPKVPEGAFTDDDTSMEWVFLHMLEEHGLNITYYQVRDEWVEHINQAIWVANARARELMDEGYVPPDTGSKERNEHWGAIDAQIECELFGVIHPGMGERAYRMAKWFAKVTNDDYAVEAAAFYAVMFSYAFFESDVSNIVKMALTKVPTSSLTHEVVSDVIKWHSENLDWKVTRQKIREKYGSYGWVSSPLNLASVVMALLYGNGDFDLSLMIAVAAGWDNDCNAATTGGLMGLIVGESGINEKWKAPLMNVYRNTNRDNLPSDTISNIASRTQAIAEKAIQAYGGAVVEHGAEKTYLIQTDMVWTREPLNDLSGENLARKRSSAPICYDRPFSSDALNKLGFLNDGLIWCRKPHSLRSQGVKGEDWWGYTFGEALNFNNLIYYSDGTSTGFWEGLRVQYRDEKGRWRDVTGLEVDYSDVLLSGRGDEFCIRIALNFDAVIGTGIRIIGRPRPLGNGTSISELEVFYNAHDRVNPPSPPRGLKAKLLEGRGVLLEWTDTSNEEYGFLVKRRQASETYFTVIAYLGANVKTYMDDEVRPNTAISYVVVAENNAGSSEGSNEISIHTEGEHVPLIIMFAIAILFVIAIGTGMVRVKISQRYL